MTEVDLFIPCFIDQLYPGIAFDTIKTLEKLNVKTHYNPQQTCCGQPAFNSGYWKHAKLLAEKFFRDFSGERPIVAPSASCTAYIKNYSPELSDVDEFHNQYKQISTQLFELTDFIVNNLNIYDLQAEFHAKITYHDACAALREYGIKNEPRILLKHVKGLQLIEMNNSETCCGFGGTFAVKHAAISSAMTEQKVQNALETGAQFIVSTEASCLMNINGYIRKHKLPIQCLHIAEILARK